MEFIYCYYAVILVCGAYNPRLAWYLGIALTIGRFGMTLGYRTGSSILRLMFGAPTHVLCFLGMIWYVLYNSVPKRLADFAAIPEVWTHKEVLNYVMLATTVFMFVRMIPFLTKQPTKDANLKVKAE